MGLSLKNKLAFTAVSILLLMLVNCEGKKDETRSEAPTVKDSLTCAKPPINPNGDSELAILMRAMRDTAASFKEMIKAGKVPNKFPEIFLKIHSAQPTDSETKKASFNGFADGYLSALKELSRSTPINAKLNYNALVQTCENCHSEHCPGPLSAIRKLKLIE